ncbi:hypothetical protein Tco_0210312 [Tanacetum coccineum]
MDDPNITMEEYIKLEEEKVQRQGRTFNWQTAKYGKMEYYKNEDDGFMDFETEYSTIVLDDAFDTALSCEPTETQGSKREQNEHLYFASANEIGEKKPELKELPPHLEYAYLKGDESCPVIISSKLTEKIKKTSLLQVLEKRKGAIAWKMSNIKGVSPSFCTQKILMKESFKPVIQPQRRLNTKVQDVVKDKIVKLLDSGLIYPI